MKAFRNFFSLVLVALAVLCIGIKSEEAGSGLEEAGLEGCDSTGLKIENEQLKSKIHSLELEKMRLAMDLKHKDVIIFEKDGIISEKSEKVAALKSDLAAMQGRKASDAEEKVTKAEARVADLKKLIAGLEAKIGKQEKEKDAAEAKSVGAESRNNELSIKLEELQKTIDQEQAKVRKTERALRAAEDEIVRIKSEANSKIEELLEAHGAWLPPWLAAYVTQYQAHWNEHGKLVIVTAFQKALEMKAEALKWAEPHLRVVHTKWAPAIKEYWLVILAHVEPHLKFGKGKSFESFETSKKAVTPHIIKLHENMDPYYQEAKKVTKPYVEHVASISRPHVEKVTLALKPFTEGVVRIYGRFLASASVYHSQVQTQVQETLKKHEWTKPFATREFEWFAKWAPAIKEYWLVILAHVEPHLKSVKVKSFETIEASKKADNPHIIKLHEHVDPYYQEQEAKKVTKPYVEHVAIISRPRVTLALEPFTEGVVRIYGRFLASASVYHGQVQAQVQETLKKHEWTKPFAMREFEWFAASALLALPVMILFRIFSLACRKKTKRTSNHDHPQRINEDILVS